MEREATTIDMVELISGRIKRPTQGGSLGAYLFALFLASAVLGGCALHICNAENCALGCCDRYGVCWEATDSQCGTGGGECSSCGFEQECASGSCQNKCRPATCKGCCNGATSCLTDFSSSSDLSCGREGRACVNCSQTSQKCTSAFTCGQCRDLHQTCTADAECCARYPRCVFESAFNGKVCTF